MTGQQNGASHSRREASRRKTKGKGRQTGIVDRGTDGLERLHRAVAGWPLDALERIHRLEKPVARVRKLQSKSITATYELVRGVSKEVSQLVNDESRKRRAPGQHKIARRGQRAKQTQRTEKAEQPDRPQHKKVAPPEEVAHAS